ncbi:MAG: 2-oxo-4-hydroxy-4-carboxy-5-ureidoimidazoline decarboxylase [Sediminibacterium sp.]
MWLKEINSLNKIQLAQELSKCCGSSKWIDKMCLLFPVEDEATLFKQAGETWYACDEDDWMEAFTHHPKIGDIDSLREKFANTAYLAAGEQSLVKQTSHLLLKDLFLANSIYEKKFGYIFIVYATGKSAEEMLLMLQQRLTNKPEDEIKIAIEEQNKITILRLKKLLTS